MFGSAFLESLPKAARWKVAAGALAASLAGVVGFGILARRHGGPTYDQFQRAGSAAAQLQARREWGSPGLRAAREAWVLDLVFPIAYGALLAVLASLGKTYAAEHGKRGAASVLTVSSWLAVVAAAADLCVENAAVGASLWSTPTDAAARIARIAGLVKWTALGALGLTGMVAALALLARRSR